MISKILGHSSIETTKIYALPAMDQMRQAMNKVDMPTDAAEKPLWEGDEDEMAGHCGLKQQLDYPQHLRSSPLFPMVTAKAGDNIFLGIIYEEIKIFKQALTL